MKQLSGLDASFLAAEDEHQPLHVSGLLIFDRPRPDFPAVDVWRRQVAGRLHRIEPLRRRLVEVPFELDHPYWVDEPDVDLDFHIRHSAIPAPGTDDQLDALVGRLVAGRMDRDHPLWVSHVIDGLAGDRFAILLMIHHAAVDGAALEEMLELLLDDDPAAEPDDPAAPTLRPGDADSEDPGTVRMLTRAALHGIERPGRALWLAARAGQQIARSSRLPIVIDAADRVRARLQGPVGRLLNLGRRRDAAGDIPRLPALFAPPSPWGAAISRYRRFQHRAVPLAEIRELADRHQVTINDVVVTLCAGGLRTWLDARGELPDQPLTAMIPVSLRSGSEDDPWTNRVSGMVTSLPTDVPDSGDRLRAAHDGLAVAKQLFRSGGADLLPDALDLPTPAGVGAIARATTRWVTAAAAPFNLVISNVPGPTEPLYVGGARQLHYVPVSAIADGQGLNITVQSYVDQLDIGLLACARLLPDLGDLADAIVAEVAELRAGPTEEAPA